MDRVIRNMGLGMFGAIMMAGGALADTVLLVPPPPKNPDVYEEKYPESFFGRAPARVDLGVSAGYASREAHILDVEGEADRAPAGLVLEKDGMPLSQGAAPARPDKPVVPTTAPATVEQTKADPRGDIGKAVTGIKGVQEVAVIASDLGFFPKVFFVARDVPVRMFVTGASKNTLCVMMDSFQVRKQVRAQRIEEITFTPNQPGKYRFYCPVNGMEGTMVVKELTSSLDP